MVQARPLSFELNEELLALLGQEFSPKEVVAKFAAAIAGKKGAEVEAAAKSVFGAFGRDWIRRAHQLGEEYSDRTWEVLQAAADQTGTLRFALFPQRTLEIAYLAINDIGTLPIIENSAQRLVWKMVDCAVNKALREKLGDEAAGLMPCRHACLSAAEALHQDLGLDAIVEMQASMAKEGYCQFGARRA